MISIRLKFVNFCFCLRSLQVEANLSNIDIFSFPNTPDFLPLTIISITEKKSH